MSVDFDSLALAPCIAAFGEAVTVTPATGTAFTMSGIFNQFATDQEISGDGEMRQVVTPTLALRIADLPAGAALPKRADKVTARGILYSIAEPIEDGFGQILLRLRQAQ